MNARHRQPAVMCFHTGATISSKLRSLNPNAIRAERTLVFYAQKLNCLGFSIVNLLDLLDCF
jgi:hypothetical protein